MHCSLVESYGVSVQTMKIPTPPGKYTHVDKHGYLRYADGHWYARCRSRWVAISKVDVHFKSIMGRGKFERITKESCNGASNG